MLISCAITAQLISVFVFAYTKSFFLMIWLICILGLFTRKLILRVTNHQGKMTIETNPDDVYISKVIVLKYIAVLPGLTLFCFVLKFT